MMGDDNGHVTSAVRRSKGHDARIVSGLVLLVIAVAISIDNRESTRVGYVFGDVRAPLILVLLIAAVFGAAIGWLLLHRGHHN